MKKVYNKQIRLSSWDMTTKYNTDKSNIRQSNIFKYKHSEAYLCNEFYYRLKLEGIQAIPEFLDNGNRYDFVVLKGKKPICIVEVKDSHRKVNLAQVESYERNSFKVPVYVLAGEELFEYILKKVIELCKL